MTSTVSRLPGVERGRPIEIEVDSERIIAHEGETIAAALLVAGRTALRRTAKQDAPRSIYCGMGICFDCLMTVNGVRNVRTCITPVEPGMKVETQHETEWMGGQ